MTYRAATLTNGLKVVTADIPGSKSVSVCVMVGVGSRYEQLDANGGASHFLEHLLFKGTKKWPTSRIIGEALDGVGGYNNAYTSDDLTCFYVKLPREHLQLALSILSDMMQHALIDPDELERERKVVLEEINVVFDDPARRVNYLVGPLLWPGNPLANPTYGSKKILREMSRQEILNFIKQHYVAGNMVFAVAGDVDHRAVVTGVERLTKSGRKAKSPEFAPLTGEVPSRRWSTHKQDTNQAHIIIAAEGYPYRHANDSAARLLTNILGQGISSRLFNNVREELGLAYTIYADYHNLVDTGQFEVYAGANLDKVEDALAAIMRELREVREQPVTSSELKFAKTKTRGNLEMALENNLTVADIIGTQMLLLGELRTPEQLLAELESVTVQDISRVAAEMLAPEKLRLAVISPEPERAVKAFQQALEEIKGDK